MLRGGICCLSGALMQISTDPFPLRLVNVHGTQLSASDTREQYRQKLARITLDSMVQFVGLLDANGTVLEINQVALDGGGLKLSDVEGKPFWTTFWWQVSEDINRVLKVSIQRAAQGEFVRWDTEIYGRASGTETIVIDASLCPVEDEHGNVVFIVVEGRDISEKKTYEREIARRRGESEETLEQKVSERTAELAASNAQLVAEAEKREKAEGRFRLLVEGVVDYALYMLDPNGVISNWNTGAARIKGYSADEVIGQHFSRFFTEEDRAANVPGMALKTAAETGKYEAEGWRVRKDGSLFWASVVLDAIRDDKGTLLGFAKITRDITERREAALALQRTQEQLVQSQKMEGIGHLTGGVAHDFNNLLAVVIGNIETLQRVLQNPKADLDRIGSSAENAMRGAQRAAALTQRLLAFSRRQPLDPKVVEVGRLVSGMSDLLRRTIGEQVAIETVLAGGLWQVHIDPNQLEVAILNLAVNARDAMPAGGKLTIETANTCIDEMYAAGQAEVLPGQYVMISVTDTGCGMSREIVARAFEPFYTTKDVGHGTGLGLSQVYGFVKQSGGHVNIYSQVGEGTTVKIYLPRLHAAEETVPESQPVTSLPRSDATETILVVEDDPDVRTHSTEILHDLGYRTFEAANGHAALKMLQTHPEIQLLFTDIGLPGGMNGRQLADAALRQRPDLKVLFTTGYARNAIVHGGRLDPGVHLITKPFTYAALASKLRTLLDVPSGPARILLVEDEELVQMIAADYLEEFGFAVETASSATEAMNKLKRLNGNLAAAIIDIGLPDRKGDVLVGEVRAIYPSLPILIASGYGEDVLRQRFGKDARVGFIGKPYAAAQLQDALASLNVVSGKAN
jgi:PAS domain S-box-containing protein